MQTKIQQVFSETKLERQAKGSNSAIVLGARKIDEQSEETEGGLLAAETPTWVLFRNARMLPYSSWSMELMNTFSPGTGVSFEVGILNSAS